MKIHSINTGFIEVPGLTTLNIYVVGCRLKCPGCHNPELQSFNNSEAYEINIQALEDKINSSRQLIDGICWMGGEPLDQPEAILRFNNEVMKEFPKLKRIIYTGYTLEEIEKDLKKRKAAESATVIKTGRWKGIPVTEEDSNQKFYIPEGEGCWNEVSYENLKVLPW